MLVAYTGMSILDERDHRFPLLHLVHSKIKFIVSSVHINKFSFSWRVSSLRNNAHHGSICGVYKDYTRAQVCIKYKVRGIVLRNIKAVILPQGCKNILLKFLKLISTKHS